MYLQLFLTLSYIRSPPGKKLHYAFQLIQEAEQNMFRKKVKNQRAIPILQGQNEKLVLISFSKIINEFEQKEVTVK